VRVTRPGSRVQPQAVRERASDAWQNPQAETVCRDRNFLSEPGRLAAVELIVHDLRPLSVPATTSMPSGVADPGWPSPGAAFEGWTDHVNLAITLRRTPPCTASRPEIAKIVRCDASMRGSIAAGNWQPSPAQVGRSWCGLSNPRGRGGVLCVAAAAAHAPPSPRAAEGPCSNAACLRQTQHPAARARREALTDREPCPLMMAPMLDEMRR
jgi:hypothetical protein